MGYKAAIDALTYLLASFHFATGLCGNKRPAATAASRRTVRMARHEIETLVGLDDFYDRENTVEEKWESASPGSPPFADLAFALTGVLALAPSVRSGLDSASARGSSRRLSRTLSPALAGRYSRSICHRLVKTMYI
jgi:hypothetical protein